MPAESGAALDNVPMRFWTVEIISWGSNDHLAVRQGVVEQPLEGHGNGCAADVPDGIDVADCGGFGTLGRLAQHPFPSDQRPGSAVAELEGHPPARGAGR